MLWRLHRAFNGLFERLRYRYMGLLDWSLRHRAPVLIGFMVVSLGSLLLVRWSATTSSRRRFRQMRLHARTPPGTRIEETELRFADVEHEIRDTLPADEIDTIIDNIGIPNSWSSLAQGDIPTISTADGEILISLNARSTAHRATTKCCCASGCTRSSRTWCSSSSRRTSPTRF